MDVISAERRETLERVEEAPGFRPALAPVGVISG